MSTTELVKLSAAEMAAKVKAKEVSSRELVEAHLDVIEAAEPSVKAFLKVSGEQALEQADAFDAKSDDEKAQLPELAGVPIAIKDMIVTKGIETTAQDPRRLGAAVRCHRHREAQGRGHAAAGQNQPRRIRARLIHRALRLPDHPQSVGYRARAGRFRRRFRSCGGRVRGPARLGNRHWRLHSSAGLADRYRRC